MEMRVKQIQVLRLTQSSNALNFLQETLTDSNQNTVCKKRKTTVSRVS